MDSKKALAILPAGTMNLFARSLGIPLTLDEAVKSFGDGEVKAVDVASANGRPFVHQFSIGMHAKLVHLRSKMDFASRLGKIRASAKAAWNTALNPPAVDVMLTIGEAEILTRATAIGITNNLFGEGHLPYADNPDGGVLGIYVTVAEQRGEILRFLLSMARGKWRDNQQVEIHQAERVTLKIRSRRTKLLSVIDGELCKLERETEVRDPSRRAARPCACFRRRGEGGLMAEETLSEKTPCRERLLVRTRGRLICALRVDRLAVEFEPEPDRCRPAPDPRPAPAAPDSPIAPAAPCWSE